jgi:CheY-like chemotaxis protein
MTFPSFVLDSGFRTPPGVTPLFFRDEMRKTAGPPYRILIVEDETLVAENIKEILEAQSFTVVGIAASGREAIKNVAEQHPDLVLMDIRIRGDMDGIQTAIILQQQSRKNTIPVVFVTAHSRNQFPHLKLLNSNYLYVTKPYSEGELIRAVKKGLQIAS